MPKRFRELSPSGANRSRELELTITCQHGPAITFQPDPTENLMLSKKVRVTLARAPAATMSSAAAIAAIFASLGGAGTQIYPSRPITTIVPFAVGGPGDTLTRIVAEHMRASLGQPIIIDNIGGAAGRIGTGRIARAAPDGYTIGYGSFSTHVVNGAAYALNYDVLKDFEPVSLIAHAPQMIVARQTMPANDLKELIAWLKSNPDKASLGTTGVGATSHLAGILFQKQTSTRFKFVPYRGTAMPDLVAGNIDLMIDQSSNALPQVRAMAIKVYALAGKSRLAAAPDIPTVDEAGLPGFNISNWYAFWAPKATPKDVVAKLNIAVVEALADPTVRRRLGDLGLEIFPRAQQSPDALAAFHKAEIERWWPIIKGAGIKVE
jgi:tripartite-type tricarboxylate transporter receptor subunit TctC